MTASQQNNKPVLWFTLPLAALVIMASLVPLGANDFYAADTINWQAQSIGQDMVNLYFVVPCLLLSVWLASRNKKGFLFIGRVWSLAFCTLSSSIVLPFILTSCFLFIAWRLGFLSSALYGYWGRK